MVAERLCERPGELSRMQSHGSCTLDVACVKVKALVILVPLERGQEKLRNPLRRFYCGRRVAPTGFSFPGSYRRRGIMRHC